MLWQENAVHLVLFQLSVKVLVQAIGMPGIRNQGVFPGEACGGTFEL